MSHIRHFFTSAVKRNGHTSSAFSISQEFRARFENKRFTRSQLLDANQLWKLTISLQRNTANVRNDTQSSINDSSIITSCPRDGTLVPPGYHLVYFTPENPESELGLDGSDKSFNPEFPFTRRMWAGGKITWAANGNLLRVGQTVTETTELKSVEPKIGKVGGEMIVVVVKKTFTNEKGLALTDERSWVFMKEQPPQQNLKQLVPPNPNLKNKSDERSSDSLRRYFNQSDVSLFRFSALTFNGHKIHYSIPWCQQVEGHPSVVVHGPLNLIHVLDMWGDLVKTQEHLMPASIEYRALNAVYAEEDYNGEINKSVDDENKADVLLRKADGKTIMKATILRNQIT